MFNNQRIRKRKLKDYTLICPKCGVEFRPFRDNQRFCTSACTVNHHREEYLKVRDLIRKNKEPS